VIREVVPGLLLLDRDRFELRVIPNEGPEVLSIDLTEPFQPFGHALRFAALKSLRHSIKQVVVRIEMSLRMRARVFVALVRARQRAFEHVAKIKDVVATRQHGMRDILVHQSKTGTIVKVFTGGVRLRINIVNQPWCREDPILKAFVVVTIL
jgi:hypothetical protein